MVDIEPFKYQASTNIKEHNEIVDKVNEIVGVINDINLDGLDPRLTADEANIKKNTDDITQLKISDTEHTAEIRAIKAKDTTQDSEIAGLTESVVSDLTATFDNNTRDLKISIEREKATSIDATVNIPASAQSGTYSPVAPITISDSNQIGLAIDTETMEITSEGTLKSKGNGSGSSYTAGTGIEIVDGVIQLTKQYDAWLKSAYNNGSYVDSTDKNFIFKTKSGINDKVSLAALAFKSDISDMETKSNASATYATKSEINDCYNNVELVDTTLTFTNIGGTKKNITLPGGSGNYVPASFPAEQGGKILGISSNGTVEPKDSNFVEPLFKANHSYFTSPTKFMTYLTTEVKIGSMVSFFALGKTATSWSGTITGIVTKKSTRDVTINYIGGILQKNNEIIHIGCSNYTTQPSILFTDGDIHIYIVKGNSIIGRGLDWDEVQGYNIIIYR